LEDAFAAGVAVCRDHRAPTHLCEQCFPDPFKTKLRNAAEAVAAGKDPDIDGYAPIYFEHPNCSGGIETHKLFAPYGVRDLLTGCAPDGSKTFYYAEVLESMVRAGFWFWPEDLRTPFRAIAARLFWDWFRDGTYRWAQPDDAPDDLLGPGDDILTLCSLCLIDPYDLVATLVTLETPQSDEALNGPLNFSANACTYVAMDTGTLATPYQDATEDIAAILTAREATAFKKFETPAWVDATFFKYAQSHPKLAQELSEFGRFYDIEMQNTFHAAAKDLPDWPVLPEL
jgi:hypothetical protein